MTTITLEIPDEQAEKWAKEAERLKVTLQQFITQSVEMRINSGQRFFGGKIANSTFESTMDYVFEKNSELYRRLA